MALRRGTRPRALITTTPRPLRLLERIREMPWTVTTTGRTSDNINLDEKFIEIMTATYGGTKLGQQELDGELLFDMEGALWPRELLARSRWTGPHPEFDRIGEQSILCACGRERPGPEPRRLGEPGRGGRGAVEHGPDRRRSQ
jgi:phage terminase large subunit-like protein